MAVAAGAYNPALQFRQGMPACGEKRPGMHEAHTAAPAARPCPGLQLLQERALVRPWYWPAGQSVHVREGPEPEK